MIKFIYIYIIIYGRLFSFVSFCVLFVFWRTKLLGMRMVEIICIEFNKNVNYFMTKKKYMNK